MAFSDSTILSLDDATIEQILSYSDLLTHLDLLRASRCCRRLLTVVSHGQAMWQQQYKHQYGALAQGNAVQDFRTSFRQRCIAEAKEQRLKLKLQRCQLQSDVTTLQRELKQMKAKLTSEQQLQQRINRQLKQLQHARQAQMTCQQWHLSSVQLYHNKVVQAAPISLEAEVASLQQQQRVSQLEVKTLQAGIRSRQSRLAARTQQLIALKG